MADNPLSLERIEGQAFKRQQIAFCILTLAVIAALLLLHTAFASLLGKPTTTVILLLASAFMAKLLEALWLWRHHEGISRRSVRLETMISAVGFFAMTGALAVYTNRDDVPYFVLLAIPILQCAYHLNLVSTMITIATAVGMIFAWAHRFFLLHPPARPTEYLELGMISVIYSVTGILVWFLVHQLTLKEARIYQQMEELDLAHETLAREEKLAAVGRLASGIAHEIRNPVAMIASSLETASYPYIDVKERDEMFTIAAREARRLEILTADFLTYARPSTPQRTSFTVVDILQHVATLTRLRAAEKEIEVSCGNWSDVCIDIDPSQIESALVNVSLNAIDATPDKGRIQFRTRVQDSSVLIEVENSGGRIPESTLVQIFEPFFTTKSAGTGLGLAIARGVARAHDGDLWVSRNQEGAVTFTMSLPVRQRCLKVGR